MGSNENARHGTRRTTSGNIKLTDTVIYRKISFSVNARYVIVVFVKALATDKIFKSAQTTASCTEGFHSNTTKYERRVFDYLR